ncbi:alpha-1-antitrypsin-like isoform X2 [Rhinatrema bivittatum]|nr:alpha-1-antitrypsin-like isoform X2 [Rhinatrema bivittatum]
MQFALCLYLCISVLYVVHGDYHIDYDDRHYQDSEKHEHTEQDHRNFTRYKIAPSNTDFAFRFYHQITSSGGSNNVVFSPVSISAAFAMLSLGAQSETLNQMIEGLCFNRTNLTKEEMHKGFHHLTHLLNKSDSKLQLSTGNALFVQKDFKVLEKFLEDLKYYYESTAFTTDFKNTIETVRQINDYVSKKTHGNIVDSVKNVDEGTSLLLISCIHFRGKWENPFNADHTKTEDFHVDENTVVQVPMMSRSGIYNAAYDEELGCTVVSLSYQGDASAFMILPDKGKLKQVENGLSRSTMKKWNSKLQSKSLELHIPKFTMSSTLDLKETLTKLGMSDVFSDEADFSGITGHRDLKVSKAIHKAMVIVDETGTEAAGVTVVELMPMSASTTVKYNKPFLILVYYYKTKSILFLGKIVDPSTK